MSDENEPHWNAQTPTLRRKLDALAAAASREWQPAPAREARLLRPLAARAAGALRSALLCTPLRHEQLPPSPVVGMNLFDLTVAAIDRQPAVGPIERSSLRGYARWYSPVRRAPRASTEERKPTAQ